MGTLTAFTGAGDGPAAVERSGAGGEVPPTLEVVEPSDPRLTVEQAPLALSDEDRSPGTASGAAQLRSGARGGGIPELPAGVVTSPLLGTERDLELHLPTADPVVVGFHEAATAAALTLRPLGQLVEDRNTTRTDLPADDASGAAYLVLSSRGRAAGPTSAIDVVMREDDPVLASVTGTVVDVRSYLLYGSYPDQRIEIAPEGRPDLRVVAIHVRDPQVDVGDEVVGGVTPIAASVRRFPFSSQIDRETEPDRLGHVHLEVQPSTVRRPGDDPPQDPEEDPDGHPGELAGRAD